jgi:Fe2+ transport system protein FeoA
MTILDLQRGQKFEIVKVTLNREVGKRLADMGFTAGTKGTLVRTALMGDPLQIQILGYNVSIRRLEAAGIEVTTLEEV